MLIDGLQKMTLLDYPGKVAATIFTFGCDFRCGFCHNPALVHARLRDTNARVSEEKIWEFLKSRKGFLEAVVITGGEPTLQLDLSIFLKKLKGLGYLVKLDTNGANSAALRDLLDNDLVDFVAMDIKNSLERYSETVESEVDLEEIKKSIRIIKDSGVDYEFRTTLVQGLHNLEDILKMAEMIKGSKKYVLQNFVSRDVLVDEKYVGCRGFASDFLKEAAKKCEALVEKCEIR